MQVIDRLLVLRLSLLLGYVISISTPFTRILNFFLQPSVFSGILTYVIEPLVGLCRFLLVEGCQFPLQFIISIISWLLSLVGDVIYPIICLVGELFKIFGSLFKVLLGTPSMIIYKFLVLVFEGVVGLIGMIKDCYVIIKTFFIPMANQRNREATMGFLQVCQ